LNASGDIAASDTLLRCKNYSEASDSGRDLEILSERGAHFLFEELFRREELRLRLFEGTLPPARRASERPIAIACFRLVTFFPERPERRVPRLRSCIALSTFWDAFFPYFRPPDFLATLSSSNPTVLQKTDRWAGP
jgi:hypothetical protein